MWWKYMLRLQFLSTFAGKKYVFLQPATWSLFFKNHSTSEQLSFNIVSVVVAHNPSIDETMGNYHSWVGMELMYHPQNIDTLFKNHGSEDRAR